MDNTQEILINSNILELNVSGTIDGQINIVVVLNDVVPVTMGDFFIDEHEQCWAAISDNTVTNVEAICESFKMPTKLIRLTLVTPDSQKHG
jgi:hypothetical protein